MPTGTARVRLDACMTFQPILYTKEADKSLAHVEPILNLRTNYWFALEILIPTIIVLEPQHARCKNIYATSVDKGALAC